MQKLFFKHRLLLGASLFVVALIAGGGVLYKSRTCEGPYCILINRLKGYKKTDVYQDTDRSYAALFKKEQNQLRLEVWMGLDQFGADEIIKNQRIRMHTLYEKSVSPYPGEITNNISCADAYVPTYNVETIKDRDTHYFTGYAAQRLTFGACNDELIAYRAAVALFYCGKQKSLYKLELFFPIGEPIEKFNEEARLVRAMPCE